MKKIIKDLSLTCHSETVDLDVYMQRASLMLTKLCELPMIQNCGLNREADDDDVHRYAIFICHLDLKIN